jgi:hypothetical protein
MVKLISAMASQRSFTVQFKLQQLFIISMIVVSKLRIDRKGRRHFRAWFTLIANGSSSPSPASFRSASQAYFSERKIETEFTLAAAHYRIS